MALYDVLWFGSVTIAALLYLVNSLSPRRPREQPRQQDSVLPSFHGRSRSTPTRKAKSQPAVFEKPLRTVLQGDEKLQRLMARERALSERERILEQRSRDLGAERRRLDSQLQDVKNTEARLLQLQSMHQQQQQSRDRAETRRDSTQQKSSFEDNLQQNETTELKQNKALTESKEWRGLQHLLVSIKDDGSSSAQRKQLLRSKEWKELKDILANVSQHGQRHTVSPDQP